MSFRGPVQRAVDAGSDGYVVARDLGALAALAASDARLALGTERPGQLEATSTRTPSADEILLRELAAVEDDRRAPG